MYVCQQCAFETEDAQDAHKHEFDVRGHRVETQSKSPIGRKFDGGKWRFSLLPIEAIRAIIDVLEKGAVKYDVDNWKKVGPPLRYYDAFMRHVIAWKAGECNDPETGLHHLAHAGCCLLFLLWFELTGSQRAGELPDLERDSIDLEVVDHRLSPNPVAAQTNSMPDLPTDTTFVHKAAVNPPCPNCGSIIPSSGLCANCPLPTPTERIPKMDVKKILAEVEEERARRAALKGAEAIKDEHGNTAYLPPKEPKK